MRIELGGYYLSLFAHGLSAICVYVFLLLIGSLTSRPLRVAVVSHKAFLRGLLEALDAPADLQTVLENCEVRSILLERNK